MTIWLVPQSMVWLLIHQIWPYLRSGMFLFGVLTVHKIVYNLLKKEKEKKVFLSPVGSSPSDTFSL